MNGLRLTRRGVGALVIAPVLLAAGLVLGLPVLAGLGGFVLGAVLVALVPALVRLRPTVRRTVHPRRLERGDRATAMLVVRNDSAQRRPSFVARDRVGGEPVDVVVPALGPGATSEHRYPVAADRRGRIDIGPLTVERSDLLGLARSRADMGEEGALWVHPRRHPLRAVGGGRLRPHHEGVLPVRPVRGSNDLRSLREYVPGDELRHVHWRASARASTLLVREYVDPVRPHCTVVLDERVSALSPEAFEEAVEVAASVVWAAVEQEHRVALHAGEPGRPAGGTEAARTLLDRLAAVTQRPDADPAQVLDGLGRDAAAGWLVLVGGAGDPALLARVAALRARFAPVTVFDLSGWPESASAPGVLTVRATRAADAVAAWNRRAAA